jgi:hypothetical protein
MEGMVIANARDLFWRDGCWAWLRYPAKTVIISGRKVSLPRYLVEVLRPEFHSAIPAGRYFMREPGCRKDCVNPWHAVVNGMTSGMRRVAKEVSWRGEVVEGRTVGEWADRAYIDCRTSLQSFRDYVVNGEVANFGPKWKLWLKSDERIRIELSKLLVELPDEEMVEARIESAVAERNEAELFRIDEGMLFPEAEPEGYAEVAKRVAAMEARGRELETGA